MDFHSIAPLLSGEVYVKKLDENNGILAEAYFSRKDYKAILPIFDYPIIDMRNGSYAMEITVRPDYGKR